MTLGLRGSLHSSVLRHLEALGLRVECGLARLGSGQRIVRAADDPAGLGVSERMRARLSSQRMAARNVADGLGLTRTGEAGLAAVAELLIRLRELAVGAASGTNTPGDLDTYQTEWDQLVDEIARLGRETRFMGLQVLGSSHSATVQVGVDAGDVLAVELTDLEPLTRRLRLGGPNSPAASARSLTLTSRSLDWIGERRARLAASARRLEGLGRSLEEAGVQLAAAESRVRDADLAVELADLTAARLIQAGATALLTQANREGALVLELLASVPPPSAPRAEDDPGAAFRDGNDRFWAPPADR